jgi:hypothetical protein
MQIFRKIQQNLTKTFATHSTDIKLKIKNFISLIKLTIELVNMD